VNLPSFPISTMLFLQVLGMGGLLAGVVFREVPFLGL